LNDRLFLVTAGHIITGNYVFRKIKLPSYNYDTMLVRIYDSSEQKSRYLALNTLEHRRNIEPFYFHEKPDLYIGEVMLPDANFWFAMLFRTLEK
jgi:hypothetical protein